MSVRPLLPSLTLLRALKTDINHDNCESQKKSEKQLENESMFIASLVQGLK